MMTYSSTRGGDSGKTFSEILLSGLAKDGGLFLPDEWPVFTKDQLASMAGKSYAEIAFDVISPYVDDHFDAPRLKAILDKTYGAADTRFHHKAITPLRQLDQNLWSLELYHGPTMAFKDVALQLLGHLFDAALEDKGERVTILGATSGDTGSAAIEGCLACKNVDIFILFPDGRVSDVQRRQMTTLNAPNVHPIALKGTFDDCQNLVKAAFNDHDFRAAQNLSAVNSINWARIIAQTVYYFVASAALGGCERPISFVVPTGNFGNIFAAYVAMKMGLPIEKLIVATNSNDILTRFFENGAMEKGEVTPTLAPSMDIQISINFESYLFELFVRDSGVLNKEMSDFADKGHFEVTKDQLDQALTLFDAGRASDAETLETIARIHREADLLMD
ncbi:MAG: threonine synthase, partial [Pseudomonadota bacterium]|nr:threonine synthase [Pseudomonadota bacterium]